MTKKSFKKSQKDLKLRHYFLIRTRGVSTPVSAALRKSVRFFSKEYNFLPLLLLKMTLQSYKEVLRNRTIHLSLRRDQLL